MERVEGGISLLDKWKEILKQSAAAGRDATMLGTCCAHRHPPLPFLSFLTPELPDLDVFTLLLMLQGNNTTPPPTPTPHARRAALNPAPVLCLRGETQSANAAFWRPCPAAIFTAY